VGRLSSRADGISSATPLSRYDSGSEWDTARSEPGGGRIIQRDFPPVASERRVTVVAEDLEFSVLPALMEEAEGLYGDILTGKMKKQEARDLAKSKDSDLTIGAADGKKRLVELTPRRSVRRKPSGKLRVSQPW
jgi:hypothetical protein